MNLFGQLPAAPAGAAVAEGVGATMGGLIAVGVALGVVNLLYGPKPPWPGVAYCGPDDGAVCEEMLVRTQLGEQTVAAGKRQAALNAKANADPTTAAGDDKSGKPKLLYHYTDADGLAGILATQRLRPSLRARNPEDAKHGNGQYLSDVVPGSMTRTQLSRLFFRVPWRGDWVTHFIGIDVRGLRVLNPKPGIYLVPNQTSLDLAGRIIEFGEVP